MDARRLLGWGLLVLGTACSSAKPTVVGSPGAGTGGSGSQAVQAEASAPRHYMDEVLGFELMQPGGWLLDETDERTPEGLAIPVVLRHDPSGAQVVLQVAPAVASPAQFAERLTLGLRAQAGFRTSDPAPLPLSDSAVGFDFIVGESVRGRVAVREGTPGNVLMMLATWPMEAPLEVVADVDSLIQSLHPLPAPERL